MAKVNDFLSSRLKKQTGSKMAELVAISSRGDLSSFSGVFKIRPLSSSDEKNLRALLQNYQRDSAVFIDDDFAKLVSLTAEIKAISNQAAILHGERIQKAQLILKNYRDGAFSKWLLAAYGNRQTPYNFLLYYEFYMQLPLHLQERLDHIPRQAVYTLASRAAPFTEKQEVIESYQGQTKDELLAHIRLVFPLEESDQRKENGPVQVLKLLDTIYQKVKRKSFSLSQQEANALKRKLEEITAMIQEKS